MFVSAESSGTPTLCVADRDILSLHSFTACAFAQRHELWKHWNKQSCFFLALSLHGLSNSSDQLVLTKGICRKKLCQIMPARVASCQFCPCTCRRANSYSFTIPSNSNPAEKAANSTSLVCDIVHLKCQTNKIWNLSWTGIHTYFKLSLMWKISNQLTAEILDFKKIAFNLLKSLHSCKVPCVDVTADLATHSDSINCTIFW